MSDGLQAHETMASDALERLALLLGITADLDDPEPALIEAVERRVAELVGRDAARGGDIKEAHRPCPT
jgi:hypothetical protein